MDRVHKTAHCSFAVSFTHISKGIFSATSTTTAAVAAATTTNQTHSNDRFEWMCKVCVRVYVGKRAREKERQSKEQKKNTRILWILQTNYLITQAKWTNDNLVGSIQNIKTQCKTMSVAWNWIVKESSASGKQHTHTHTLLFPFAIWYSKYKEKS